MYAEGLNKFYWGFLFIMIDFRISGFDILPDIVGFILFAVGFGLLASGSGFFARASNLNIAMILLSIFSIYEAPAQGGGVQFGPFWPVGILIGIGSTVLTLLVVYNLFMGVKELAGQQEQPGLAEEAEQRWKQFWMLQVAVLAALILIFIPPLAIIYIIALLVASIALTVVIMGYIKRCEQSL
jgi:hypothetical protein